MKYAIMEWSVKDRRWAIIEECDQHMKRAMRMRYNFLCSRYPNNSFKLVELTWTLLDERVSHRDAERYESK